MKTHLHFKRKINYQFLFKLILFFSSVFTLFYSCKKYDSDFTNKLDNKKQIQKISEEDLITWVKDNPAAKYITPDWSKAKQTIVKGKQLVKVPLLNVNKSPNSKAKSTDHYYESHPPEIYFIADKKEKSGFKSFMLNFVPDNPNSEFGEKGIWTGKLYEWNMTGDSLFVQVFNKNKIVKRYYQIPKFKRSNPETLSSNKKSKSIKVLNFWDWLGDTIGGVANAVWDAVNFIGYHLGVPGSVAWDNDRWMVITGSDDYTPGNFGGSENGGTYGFDLIYSSYLNNNYLQYDYSTNEITVDNYTWDPVYYAGVGSYLSPANVLNAQLDNAIHWGDVNWLDNNYAVRDALDYYLFTLNTNMPQADKIAFARFTIDFMQDNTNVSIEEFENWFMKIPEGIDGNYDSNFVQNYSLQQIKSLPSLINYYNAFPKNEIGGNIYPMAATDVYTLVGGSMNTKNKNNVQNYQNACALRGSRALNYCNLEIPEITGTEKGSDNKNYILSAKNFNEYMNKTFGEATYKLTGTDLNSKAAIANFLKGKTGIYTIVNINASYSGHVDMIINGKCISGSYINPPGGISKIEIWELP